MRSRICRRGCRPTRKENVRLRHSTGALACAKILKAAPNLEYIVADKVGFAAIPDGSLDVIYSFAMVQHVTDEVFEMVLANCCRKLNPAGDWCCTFK